MDDFFSDCGLVGWIKEMSEDYREPVRIDNLVTGTIFLQLNGEERMLGIITNYDPGDRAAGSVDIKYENGTTASHCDCGGGVPNVFPLAKVEVGKNPLRSLLNWAAKYD